MAKLYHNAKVTRQENGDTEITASLTAEALSHARIKALKNLNERIDIPGFRKGHIPEKVLVERVGEAAILDEAAHEILPEATYEILVGEKIEAIGRPEITITKLSPSEPVEFKVTASTLPEITLPDYKKIAKEEYVKPEEKIEVTDEEVSGTIKELQKMRIYDERVKKDKEAREKNSTPENRSEITDADLPEANDDFARGLGDFKDLADLKEKIKENIAKDKARKADEKKRIALAETLVASTKVGVPSVLVESELARMHAQFHDDVGKMGLKMEDYLKHIKKTEEELRIAWRPDAEKKAKLELILDAIAKAEKLEPSQEDVNHEVSHLLEHYKGADPGRVKSYVEMVLTNEKVFEFFKQQK